MGEGPATLWYPGNERGLSHLGPAGPKLTTRQSLADRPLRGCWTTEVCDYYREHFVLHACSELGLAYRAKSDILGSGPRDA